MAFANASIQPFFVILSPRLETLIFLMFAVVIIETLVFLRYERRLMKSFLAAITCNGISFLWGGLLLPIPDLILNPPMGVIYDVTARGYRRNPILMNDLAQYFSPEYLSIHQSVFFLYVICLVGSIVIEGLVIKWLWSGDTRKVWTGVIHANFMSYVIIGLFMMGISSGLFLSTAYMIPSDLHQNIGRIDLTRPMHLNLVSYEVIISSFLLFLCYSISKFRSSSTMTMIDQETHGYSQYIQKDVRPSYKNSQSLLLTFSGKFN